MVLLDFGDVVLEMVIVEKRWNRGFSRDCHTVKGRGVPTGESL